MNAATDADAASDTSRELYFYDSAAEAKPDYEVENVQNRGIVIPSFDVEFAEFMGALAGDGHITDSGYSYRIEFTFNGTEDGLYADFIAVLFKDLFNVNPRVYRRSGETNRVDVQVHSKKIYNFLSMFFPSGKKDNLSPPKWVDSKEKAAAYLRGLMDTDGSLFFAKRGTYKRNSYPVMEIKMHDASFLDEVEDLLELVDLDYYRSSDIKIQFNGEEKLEEWVSRIGFNNINRISRYQVWKLHGFCPPDTTLEDRLEIIRAGVTEW